MAENIEVVRYFRTQLHEGGRSRQLVNTYNPVFGRNAMALEVLGKYAGIVLGLPIALGATGSILYRVGCKHRPRYSTCEGEREGMNRFVAKGKITVCIGRSHHPAVGQFTVLHLLIRVNYRHSRGIELGILTVFHGFVVEILSIGKACLQLEVTPC